MAQYDEFGRPIYETAEEYNRARKTGRYSRSTESQEKAAFQNKATKETYRTKSSAQRYTHQDASKKTKKLIVGVGAFILVFNVIIIATVGSFGVSFESDYEDNWVETMVDMDDEGEYLGDDFTPLPSGFETFSFNGQTYTLPESYEKLVDKGFIEDGDCFYIDNPMLYDETVTVPDFVFGDGLTFESSYEELETYFGIPYYHYEDHSDSDYIYDSYEWCYNGDDEYHYVNVTFLNGMIYDVVIDKTVYEE